MLPSAHWKCRTQKNRQKVATWAPSHTLLGYIFATEARIDNRKKNLLSSNISSTCPHNMLNFGSQATEIGPVVWGTPANFSGFRVLAALLHGTLVVGVSQTVALNRGRHLYLAGRPSRWHWPTFLVSIFSLPTHVLPWTSTSCPVKCSVLQLAVASCDLCLQD